MADDRRLDKYNHRRIVPRRSRNGPVRCRSVGMRLGALIGGADYLNAGDPAPGVRHRESYMGPPYHAAIVTPSSVTRRDELYRAVGKLSWSRPGGLIESLASSTFVSPYAGEVADTNTWIPHVDVRPSRVLLSA